MQTPPFVDELPSRNPDLLNQVREGMLLPLSDAFAAELDAAGAGLFQLADTAAPALQKEYLDAVQELKRDRESLVQLGGEDACAVAHAAAQPRRTDAAPRAELCHGAAPSRGEGREQPAGLVAAEGHVASAT